MSGSKNKSRFILYISLVAVSCGVFLYTSSKYSSEISFTAPIHAIDSYKTKSTVSILVTGDIMLDRNVRNIINKIGFDAFFSGVKDLISESDIAVANLEGPFTLYPSKTASLVSKELTFTFDPALAPKLSELGFDVLGLANNHSLNFGGEGLTSTRKYILDAGMQYYGHPNNSSELSTVVVKDGISVAFVGFHEFSYMNFDKVLAEIDSLRPQVDILVVSPHWGTEYQKEPTVNMKKWAYEFIDHGADAVIGAHTHIVGDTEEYNGKKIYYSLGNFAFDQYFSEATMSGLVVKMEVEKGKEGISIEYIEIPVRVERKGVFVATSTQLIPAR